MFKIKKRKQGHPKLEAFRKKLQANERFKEEKMLVSTGSGNKLSEILERFVEPYQHLATTSDEYQRLITIASVAWNAALLPEDERQTMLEEAYKTAMPSASDKAAEDFHAMINELIDRKRRFFSGDERFIVDTQLDETENGHHLSVASVPLDRANSSTSGKT